MNCTSMDDAWISLMAPYGFVSIVSIGKNTNISSFSNQLSLFSDGRVLDVFVAARDLAIFHKTGKRLEFVVSPEVT